jgi:hypothetical protein
VTTHDAFIRRALWVTTVFNFIGAAAFFFPDTLGQLAGLPAPVPLLYRGAMAFLIGLFGATYAWLALQPRLDRPLLAFAAIGKAGFFSVVVLCWLPGEAPLHGVVTAAGDLAFAAIFAWWLLVGSRGAPTGQRPQPS